MELNGRRPYRTVQVVFNSFDKEGKEHTDTLNIKYKPVDETWFDLFDVVREKIERLKDEGLKLVASLAQEENKLQELGQKLQEASDDQEKETLQAAYDEQKLPVEDLRTRIDVLIKENRKIQSEMLAEQLSPILISLDMTLDGKPFEPSVENLVFLGMEFCLDVLEVIQKKVHRRRAM